MHHQLNAVTVANCTSAMFLALKSLGIGPGDEVIVPAMTHIATAHCVLHTGAKVVFCDIEKETGKNSLSLIKETLVEETDKQMKINSFDEDFRQLVETIIKTTRQKLDNQNLQKLLKKRIEVTRSILDLNNSTQ